MSTTWGSSGGNAINRIAEEQIELRGVYQGLVKVGVVVEVGAKWARGESLIYLCV
jgi:hypothetical protein